MFKVYLGFIVYLLIETIITTKKIRTKSDFVNGFYITLHGYVVDMTFALFSFCYSEKASST